MEAPLPYAPLSIPIAGRIDPRWDPLWIHGDPSALARLRAGLRERLLASRLCDRAAIGASFGAELRTMWVRRCAKDQEQTHA